MGRRTITIVGCHAGGEVGNVVVGGVDPPPGEGLTPSDLLSEQLDVFGRDAIYEAAVVAAVGE